jgi:integrase
MVYAGTGPDGKKVQLTETVHGTKQAAKDREGELRKKARAGVAQGSGATVDVLLDRWLEVARHEPSTRTRTDSYLRVHVRPTLGPKLVVKVSTADLDRLYVTLDKTLAPATVRRVHGIVRAAFEQAVTWGWIDRNPAARARLTDLSVRPPDAPDVEQVKLLLKTALETDPALFAFMRIGATTGMRKGEVCALRRQDVDLEQGIIRRTAAVGEAKGGVYVKATKTGRRDQLAIAPATAQVIVDHLARQDAELLEAGFPTPGPDAFLFSNDAGLEKPWRPDHVSKRFAAVRALAEVDGVQIRKLRHFVATELLGGGFSTPATAARLGNDPRTMLGHYGGDSPPDDLAAAAHLDGLLD